MKFYIQILHYEICLFPQAFYLHYCYFFVSCKSISMNWYILCATLYTTHTHIHFYASAHSYIHIHTHTHTHTYMYIYVSECVCVFTLVCICGHVCIVSFALSIHLLFWLNGYVYILSLKILIRSTILCYVFWAMIPPFRKARNFYCFYRQWNLSVFLHPRQTHSHPLIIIIIIINSNLTIQTSGTCTTQNPSWGMSRTIFSGILRYTRIT